MKKFMSICLALGTVVGTLYFSNTPVYAKTISSNTTTIESPQPKILGYFRVTSTIGAYVRSGPGYQYSVIGSGNYGQDLIFWGSEAKDSRGVKWYQVKASNGKVGWATSEAGYLF